MLFEQVVYTYLFWKFPNPVINISKSSTHLKNNIILSEGNNFPKASICGLISYKYDRIKAENALPFYLRPSQAERLFNS